MWHPAQRCEKSTAPLWVGSLCDTEIPSVPHAARPIAAATAAVVRRRGLTRAASYFLMAHVPSAALRDAMSRFPTGVTVVTALGPAGPAGATANAVASLSLEPPLMLACLDLGSRTLVAVEHSRLFGVNVLSADQADLARRFSTKDPHPEKWDGVSWSEQAGTPMIEGSAVWLTCELAEVHEGGDHSIVTGTVTELQASGGKPLVFFDGEYRPLEA